MAKLKQRTPKTSFPRVVAPPLVQKLRRRDDRLDQAAERVPVRRQPPAHRVERFAVRKHQAAAQRVRKPLLAQVIDELPSLQARGHTPHPLRLLRREIIVGHWPSRFSQTSDYPTGTRTPGRKRGRKDRVPRCRQLSA